MMWHEERSRFKEDKIVVKLMNKDGTFKKSVAIPSEKYPLNDKYRVFTYANTQYCQDPVVLQIFDDVKYRHGRCYTNAKELAERLRNGGYDAKAFAGWLFTEATDFPIHHCWVVLNGNVILDLSDDFSVMLSGENGKLFLAAKNREELRNLHVSFQLAAAEVPNSIRCSPVGQPTPFLMYVGCECDPDEARIIYQKLMLKYPNHEVEWNCDASGLNATQKAMREAGLIV